MDAFSVPRNGSRRSGSTRVYTLQIVE